MNKNVERFIIKDYEFEQGADDPVSFGHRGIVRPASINDGGKGSGNFGHSGGVGGPGNPGGSSSTKSMLVPTMNRDDIAIELQKDADRVFDKGGKTLQDAVDEYTATAEINYTLRNNGVDAARSEIPTGGYVKSGAELIDPLDAAIAESVNPTMETRRIVDEQFLNEDGSFPESFTDSAYVSTSIGDDIVFSDLAFAGPLEGAVAGAYDAPKLIDALESEGTKMLKIRIPEGKGHGLYVGKRSIFGSQEEYILKRGTAFRFLGMDGKTAIYTIEE
jgi:hypothetical protein